MRTRHLRWDLATLLTFRWYFEIDRRPGLGLEARRESHWENRRTAAGRLGDGTMSFFVCFLYASKAAVNMSSKFVEEVATDETWDIIEGDMLVV
jgi:hypothetical protein